MNAYNSTISDTELRDLFRMALIGGDETNALTETFIEMEQKMVFSGEAAFVLPLQKEQELFNQLNHGLGAKLSTAGKLGMKWIFTGLGGACVATGLVVYTQLKPDHGEPKNAVAPAALTTTDSAQQPHPADSILVQAPTDSFTPETVTKQLNTPEQLSPVISNTISLRIDQPVQEWEAAARGEQPAPPEQPAAPVYRGDDQALSDTIFHGVKRLEIDIDVADIHILPSQNEDVTLVNPLQASAVEQKGSTLKIISPKDCRKRLIRVSDKVMEGQLINIRIPRGTELILHTSAGRVSIDGVHGNSCEASCDFGDIRISNSTMKTTVTASSGQVRLENHYGDIDATASFGDIYLSQVNGKVKAHASSGNVSSSDITGTTDIESDFGNIDLSNVRGEVTLRAASGNITLNSANANHCSIVSDFGNLELSDIQANTHLVANSGNIVLQGMTGKMEIESAFGDITTTDVHGELKLMSSSGSTTIRDLEGDLRANVDFGDLKIQNSKGNASLVVTSGNIETKDMELTDSLDIVIDFGDGKIGLKNKNEELRFDLESTYGKVKVNKGDMKLEKENGTVTGGTGRIAVRGTTGSGSLTFN
jgi:DUF4097 and DUF4098 domain-containing protein YvlB